MTAHLETQPCREATLGSFLRSNADAGRQYALKRIPFPTAAAPFIVLREKEPGSPAVRAGSGAILQS